MQEVRYKDFCQDVFLPVRGSLLQLLAQARNLANLPFTFKHVAIMPDAHPGDGMPIGGVLATEDVVIPNAVGVDIGCGMSAVQTSLTEIDQESLSKILGSKQ